MKTKTVIRLALEGALVAACPPAGILIGMNEVVNFAGWLKKRKGQWTEKDADKALCLKMMAGNPGAAVELLSKAAFKDKPPEVYKVVSKTLATGMALRGDLESLLNVGDKAGGSGSPTNGST